MRIAFLVAAIVPMAGCIGEVGLPSSPTDCNFVPPSEVGFLIHINGSEPFVGYCVEISHRYHDTDNPISLSKVPQSGTVFLPVPTSGEYYFRSSVTHADDNYCADHFGEFEFHPGEGVIELTVEANVLCA